MGKRHLYESAHPFDAHPFEAFCWGSWKMVELLRIKNGTMTLHLIDSRRVIPEKCPFSNLRVRSRRATLTDCTCFLRPGIDVCVLSSSQHTGNSNEENQDLVWLDAKISSIERKPHEHQCSCQFYIKLYVNQGPFGSEKVTLSKDTEVVGVNQISILQKLEKHPCEDQHYRWSFSEDCSSLQRTKLCLGKFSSDLSLLLVASVLKRVAFHVRSVQNKIVYQILADDYGSSSKSDSCQSAVNFRVDNGVTQSKVIQFAPADAVEESHASGVHEPGLLPFNLIMDLRRSKRRNVQPERFLGCDRLQELDTGWVQMMPCKTDKCQEDEDTFLPLPCLFGLQACCSEKQTEGERKDLYFERERKDLVFERKRKYLVFERKRKELIFEQKRKDLVVCKSKTKPREVKVGVADQREHQNDLAVSPLPTDTEPLAFQQGDFYTNFSRNYSEEVDEISSKYYNMKSSHTVQRKKTSQLEDMEFESTWEGLQGKASNRKARGRRYWSIFSEREDYDEQVTSKRISLNAGAYNKLIHSYMKNIDSTMTKEEGHVIYKWEEFKAASCSGQWNEAEQSSSKNEGETSENEMLWREMELSMASSYFLEENEVTVSNETLQKSSGNCQHDYRLNEEIGIYCRLCDYVSTEIKHVSAPFMEYKTWTTENKQCSEEDTKKIDEDEEFDLSGNHASPDMPSPEEHDNVWALIPELRKKLHFHQNKAYKFLWKNITGSLVPTLMEPKSENIGGCVISHSPGAGKTFLIIAFLVSYLKLFPGKRPLVLAPKTTLYTWYKEFIKWEIPVPVHLIHGCRTYRVFMQKKVRFRGVRRPSQDVMHVLDCLEKILKWHEQPSVLLMSYTSFLTLMREDSKFAHRRHMAKVLRESPGLLVLDEGHNPRSTKSRLRKVLMKVKTDLRILLSGTLFQNNFCEYFNTLCLARPKFVNEVLMELDPKFKMKKTRVEKARALLENRARKLFLDKIAKKIDANAGEERMQGLNMLRNITNGFIDVYEGGGSDTLPGLQIYTLMMNSTDVQHETLVKLHDIMATHNGYPLELELLITLASIHPWLIKTSNCVSKFFSVDELMQLEKLKFDSRKGSKVMFVLNLVYRVVKREKVLIFCHNIAPINLFLELFENVFRWQKGREVLVLTGDLELFERGRVMDKFEEPGGASRVLLASITACAEGISLTAASRVILLDSEWNPSKTKQAIARAFRPGQRKVVYVYQLLARDTLEEDKYRRTTWKEWVSSMIFSEAFVENPYCWQAEKIEDDILREIIEEDRVKSFHMIMKNEKASTGC